MGIDAALPEHLEVIAQHVAADLTSEISQPRVAVAYSGGVDSSVLVALTARALGPERTTAVLGISPSLAARERRLAHRQAELMGVAVLEIATHELGNQSYAANPVDRCYYCKDELFTRMQELTGFDVIAYGENADDAARVDRPGGRAAREHHVRYPLATAGATKTDIRQIAEAFGLASATKPAAPCLASRIPHGQEVTAEKLGQIDLAEDAVLAAGFTDCRVRHHGEIARIEIPAAEFGRWADEAVRSQVVAAIRAAGFRHVTVDLAGIQSGAFTLTLMERPA